MTLLRISALVFLLTQVCAASAQTYKCVGPNGKPVYQQSRCPAGHTSQLMDHQKQRTTVKGAPARKTETLTVTEGAVLVPRGGVYRREGDMLAAIQGELPVTEGMRVLVKRGASFQVGDKLVQPQQVDHWVVFRVVASPAPAPAAAPASAPS